MAQDLYSGEYVKFYAVSEKGAGDFMGADNLVGDAFEIAIKDENDEYRAYLVNKFGATIGYLEASKVRDVQLAQAKGWRSVAYLSFIAFTEGKGDEEPGYYWGEMAVLLYDSKLDAPMKAFSKKLSSTMADGGRPQVDFGDKAVEQLVSSNGKWFPTGKKAMPKMKKGSTIIKDHRTPNERLIEQSRSGNKGCYVVSYAFIFLIVAGLIYLLHSCGVF